MSSVKETMKHASIYSMAAVLGKMVGFLMLPFYANILQSSGYAVIGMLDAGVALLVSMLAFGVRGASVRLYHDQDKPEEKKAVISTGIAIILVVSSLMVIPLFLFSRPIASLLLDNADYSRFLIMALITFIFDMCGQGASSWLLIQSQSVKFAAINLLRLIMGLSLNIWLIVIEGMGLDGYFISMVTTSILVNCILMFYTFRDCGKSFDRRIAKQFRDFLLPLIPGNLMSFASRQAERYLVKFQIDLASVGILEMGYKFPVLIAQLITRPFMQSWNTRRFEIADEPTANRRIGEMYTYYLFLVTFMGLVMAVIIKPLLTILTPPEFHTAYRIAQVEIITMILSGSYFHLTFGLLYVKHTHTLARIRGWTAIIKVGISWFCISLWGIAGAAWSAAIIGLCMVVVGFICAQRQYHICMEWKKIALICCLALGMFTILNLCNLADIAIYQTIENRWLPLLIDGIKSSPLGDWKDGKLPIVLAERCAPITEMVVNGFLSALFGLLLPLIHNETRHKLLKFVFRR